MGRRVRLTISGTLAHGEDFAFGVDTTADTIPDQGTLDEYVDEMADLVKTTVLSPDVLGIYPSTTIFQGLRGYLYLDDAAHASGQAYRNLGPVPGNGSGPLPNQLAVCCTTRTSRPGRSYRGRFYLPAGTVDTIGNAGQLTNAQADSLATSVKNWLSGIPGLSHSESAMVWSTKLKSGTGIETIAVDTRFDIQRRRAAGVAASYTANRTI